MVRTVFTEMIEWRLVQQGVTHAHGSKGLMADEVPVILWFILVSAGRTTSSLSSCSPDSVLPVEQEFRLCSEIGIAIVDCSSAFGGLSLFLSLKCSGHVLEGIGPVNSNICSCEFSLTLPEFSHCCDFSMK